MAKSDELQRQTQRVLLEMGEDGKALSARAAGEKLDIGYNQIADMARGKVPAEKTLIKFASAITEPAAQWLRYAGKHDFAKALDAFEPSILTPEQQALLPATRELAQLPPKRRALVIKMIHALVRAAAGQNEE